MLSFDRALYSVLERRANKQEPCFEFYDKTTGLVVENRGLIVQNGIVYHVEYYDTDGIGAFTKTPDPELAARIVPKETVRYRIRGSVDHD